MLLGLFIGIYEGSRRFWEGFAVVWDPKGPLRSYIRVSDSGFAA